MTAERFIDLFMTYGLGLGFTFAGWVMDWVADRAGEGSAVASGLLLAPVIMAVTLVGTLASVAVICAAFTASPVLIAILWFLHRRRNP